MKLDKFTKICINLVLILVIALLLKSLIAVPRDVYANPGVKYKVWCYERVRELNNPDSREGYAQSLEARLNEFAKQGWKFHSETNYSSMLFER